MVNTDTIYLPLLLFLVVIGVVATTVVALKPKLFWPMLIFVTVSGSGAMIEGYALIDEFLVGCVLVGGFLALGIKPVRQRYVSQKSHLNKLHNLIFLLWMGYMTLQSLCGLILLDDMRMIRYVIFFTMLGVLSWIISKEIFPTPSPEKMVKILLVSTLFYFTLYLGHGVLTEFFRGMKRFDVQGDEWSGSTVAMFPLFTVIPAVFFMLENPRKLLLVTGRRDLRRPWLGWAVMTMAIATSFYYDSRISWVAIIGFCCLSMHGIGLNKVAVLLSIFLATFFLMSALGGFEFAPGMASDRKVIMFFETLGESAGGFVGRPRESDLDRLLANVAGFKAASAHWTTFIFGSGFYTHRYIMIPYYFQAMSSFGLVPNIQDIVRPPSFAAFLVDIGLFGMLLLFVCLFLTACEIITRTKYMNRRSRMILLFSLLLMFLSLFASINYDVILLYFAIMPAGLLVQMSRYETMK